MLPDWYRNAAPGLLVELDHAHPNSRPPSHAGSQVTLAQLTDLAACVAPDVYYRLVTAPWRMLGRHTLRLTPYKHGSVALLQSTVDPDVELFVYSRDLRPYRTPEEIAAAEAARAAEQQVINARRQAAEVVQAGHLPILGGALAALPVGPYGADMGSNADNAIRWLAIVEPDGAAPGGMTRRFLAKSRSDDTFYMVRDIEPGQLLELACDRIWGDERKRRRLYMHVLNKTDDQLDVAVFYSLRDAALARRAASVEVA